jgi:hypothetical protein
MRIFRLITGAVVVALTIPTSASAAGRGQLFVFNVGTHAALTVVRSAVERKIRNRGELLRTLLWGGAAGAGFYEAKVAAGSGRLTTASIIANFAASVTDNAVAQRQPLSELGYTIGPIRIRVPVTHSRRGTSPFVSVDISQFQAIQLIFAIKDNDRFRLKGGLLAFERDTPYKLVETTDENVKTISVTAGDTAGVFPAVWAQALAHGFSDPWPHEFVHALQSLQLDSVEPNFVRFGSSAATTARRDFIKIDRLNFGIVNLANQLLTSRQRYVDRWGEIEAYRLADRSSPIPEAGTNH